MTAVNGLRWASGACDAARSFQDWELCSGFADTYAAGSRRHRASWSA